MINPEDFDQPEQLQRLADSDHRPVPWPVWFFFAVWIAALVWIAVTRGG